MINSVTHVLTKVDPLRYLMSKPCLNGRSTKWVMLLQEFDLRFVKQQLVKGQAIADFVANFPTKDSTELREEFQDECNLTKMIDYKIKDHWWSSFEQIKNVSAPFLGVSKPWKLYFDGCKCMHGLGAGIVLISPKNNVIPMSYKLSFKCTNNMVEYEALILGLKATIEIGVTQLHIFGDSQLIVN